MENEKAYIAISGNFPKPCPTCGATKDDVLISWEKAIIFVNSPFFELWQAKLPYSGKRMIVVKIGNWARRLIF